MRVTNWDLVHLVNLELTLQLSVYSRKYVLDRGHLDVVDPVPTSCPCFYIDESAVDILVEGVKLTALFGVH